MYLKLFLGYAFIISGIFLFGANLYYLIYKQNPMNAVGIFASILSINNGFILIYG